MTVEASSNKRCRQVLVTTKVSTILQTIGFFTLTMKEKSLKKRTEATEGNVIKKEITGKYSMDTDEEFLRKHRMEKMNEKEEKVIVEPSIYS
jgi:beta-glucosidase/6-phospho-beta-glucosidase/beta-galactosidase